MGVAASLMAGCAEEEAQQERERVAVRLVEAEEATLRETARAVGSLRSATTAELQAEVPGRVETVHFEEGAEVEQGELLFSLRDDALRAQRSALRASLRAAQARVERAERALARREPLTDTGAVAEEELTTTQTELSEARAEVGRVRAELRELEEQLSDTRVRAPFDGRISQRLVDSGDFVQVGEQVATLYQGDTLEAELRLPERLARRVRLGQAVRVVPADSEELAFDARVTFVSPAVEVAGRDLVVKARPDEGTDVSDGVTPGMSVTAELVLETRRGRPVVPAEALVGGREGYSVFVVEDGTAYRRPVRIGLREPGRVEVVEGLQAGEQVVREGHMRLTDGAAVRAVGEGANAGESP